MGHLSVQQHKPSKPRPETGSGAVSSPSGGGDASSRFGVMGAAGKAGRGGVSVSVIATNIRSLAHSLSGTQEDQQVSRFEKFRV